MIGCSLSRTAFANAQGKRVMITIRQSRTSRNADTPRRWCAALLLLGLLIPFSGLAQYTHNRQQHDLPAAHHASHHHHDNDSRPTPQSKPSAPHNCPLCLALSCNVATAADLSADVFDPQFTAYQVGLSADPRLQTSPLHTHAGRSPPRAIL